MGQVVHLQELNKEIIEVKMEDRAARNTFSYGLIEGFEQEIRMHKITFHHPEVARRIERLFGN